MANEFTQETRALNVFEPYCEVCKSNKECSLHHIYGRVSKSAVNGIYLCGKCHRKADIHNRDTGMKGTEPRRRLLEVRLRNLVRWGYIFNTEDTDFIETIHKDIMDILH